MKTAIQTACNEIVDELINDIELVHMTKIIHIMHKHLETEKQQIIDAVTHGNRMEFYDATETAGGKYYTSKFETNKETLK